MIFCCAPSKCQEQNWSKFSLKAVYFLITYESFLNHSCGKAFCKIDFRTCFAKSLQSILILHCWDCLTLYCEKERWNNWASFEKLILDDSFSFHFCFSKVLLRTCMQTFGPIQPSVSKTIGNLCEKLHLYEEILSQKLNIH